MGRSDKIIFWLAVFLGLETAITWFIVGWYWFDISVATIIATLVLIISFLAKERFLELFFIYMYFIKLTNIISLYVAYGHGKFKDVSLLSDNLSLLNGSKPIMNILLYVWFTYAFISYAKGWDYKQKEE